MPYDYNLNALADFLSKEGFAQELGDLKKLLVLGQQTFTESDWKNVIAEVEKPLDPTGLDLAINYMVNGAFQLAKSAKKLEGVEPETIQEASGLVAQINKESSLNYDLAKIASLSENAPISKEAQIQWLKQFLGPKATSLLSQTTKGGAKIVPVVGALFSFIFAAKNIYYGYYQYQKLVSDASAVGLSAKDTLSPKKLSQQISLSSENPNELTLLAKTTKTARAFWDEAISGAANSIDFVKDIIFLVLEFGSAGLAIIGDIGISIILMLIEAGAESEVLGSYDGVLKYIKTLAEEGLRKLEPKKEYLQFEKEDEDTRKWQEKAMSRYLLSPANQ